MKLSIAAAALFSAIHAKQDKCYALALSGGANNGAWEAGVMWGLAHYGKPEDFEWDVITGVSAGAVNTAVSALWAKEDLVEFTEWYSDVIAHTKTHEIWK
jgi:predicted acylesterase/phospholipase RssA